MLKRKKVKPIALRDVTIIDGGELRKATIAASLGSVMEQFDFGVYGLVAYALSKVFFLGADPSMQMVVTLATFPVSSLIRSLGGLFFSMLGNKYGRQKTLVVTIVTMSISTFYINLISSYDTTGTWAPILLLVCKTAQSFSVDGEYTGASIFVTGYLPDRKRSFMGSQPDFDSTAGSVLGAGVVVLISTIVSEEDSFGWGWCIPLFTALPLGIIGLYLCHAPERIPAFQQYADKPERGGRKGLQDDPKVSFKEIVTKHWYGLLTCIGLAIATDITYYMLLTYILSHLSHSLHYSEDHEVLIITTIMIGMLLVQPVMGLLSDRFSHRPLVLLGSVALFMLMIPMLVLTNSNAIGLALAGLLMLAVIPNCFTGVVASILPAMFPTHIRYSTLAAVFNIPTLAAGLMPTLTAWLVKSSQNLMMPAYYLMVVTVVGLITGVTMKETANRLLKGAILATSDIQEAKEIPVEHYDNIEQKIDDTGHEITDLRAKRIRLVQQHPRIGEQAKTSGPM